VSLELRWTERAVNQLGGIAEYIALVSPVYAERTVDRIVARLRQAQDFPESGRPVSEAPTLELRELLELPYRLIYRVVEDTIVVIAIVHGKQDLPRHLSG
jgi:plasmid stabilization system protein ParE